MIYIASVMQKKYNKITFFLIFKKGIDISVLSSVMKTEIVEHVFFFQCKTWIWILEWFFKTGFTRNNTFAHYEYVSENWGNWTGN